MLLFELGLLLPQAIDFQLQLLDFSFHLDELDEISDCWERSYLILIWRERPDPSHPIDDLVVYFPLIDKLDEEIV